MPEETADRSEPPSESIEDLQQEILLASSPGVPFQQLSPIHKQEVFFLLPEPAQRTLVDEMDTEALRRFVQRLDPDEATDVLGFFIILGLVTSVLRI